VKFPHLLGTALPPQSSPAAMPVLRAMDTHTVLSVLEFVHNIMDQSNSWHEEAMEYYSMVHCAMMRKEGHEDLCMCVSM